jgi:hypothetical protein
MSVRFFKSSSIKSGEKTNKFWDQSASVFDSDYDLITTTLITTNTASVTFGSLGDYSSTYKHLQIRFTIQRTGSANSLGGIELQFNGNTGSNYAMHLLDGNGTSVVSQNETSTNDIYIRDIIPLVSETNNFGAGIIDILDPYSTSKNTTVRFLKGAIAPGEKEVGLGSGFFNNTASITSIKIEPEFESFVSGSRFSLYGIRG